MKVYLAGPDVFRPNALEIFAGLKAKLLEAGLTALVPLDNEVTNSSDPIGDIYAGNVKMLNECDVVLANIAPFRGVHMDPGTAFEIGYAIAKGKPVYGYTPFAHETLAARVRRVDGVKPAEDMRDSVGDLIENFGRTENLMIAVPAEAILLSFDQALEILKRDQAKS